MTDSAQSWNTLLCLSCSCFQRRFSATVPELEAYLKVLESCGVVMQDEQGWYCLASSEARSVPHSSFRNHSQFPHTFNSTDPDT